jgi:tRNA A37 threonylcarbamoyladenosine dehydratase
MSVDRYSRQSFLGPDAEARIPRCTVGVVGLGGGGSHIVQQLVPYRV